MSFQKSATLPSVVYGADQAAYHKQGAQYSRGDARRTMSRSELSDFAKCPRKWLRGIPDESTNDMAWGSLVDAAFLTPDQFETIYAIADETYPSEGMECPVCKSVTSAKTCRTCKVDRVKVTVQKEWDWNASFCSEWRAEQVKAGKKVVKSSTASEAWKAAARLKEDGEIQDIMKDAKTQVQINVDWHDNYTGLIIPFRCLLDVLPSAALSDTIWDFKATNDASVRKWQRTVYEYELHIQASIYMMAVNVATGLNFKNFGHIIQESSEPYEPVCRILTFEFVSIGKKDFTYQMERYCRCLKSGNFPGYDDSPVDAEAWMIMNP